MARMPSPRKISPSPSLRSSTSRAKERSAMRPLLGRAGRPSKSMRDHIFAATTMSMSARPLALRASRALTAVAPRQRAGGTPAVPGASGRGLHAGAQQHSVEIAGIVGVGDKVEFFDAPAEAIPGIAKRGEILDRETDAVEQRDGARIA